MDTSIDHLHAHLLYPQNTLLYLQLDSLTFDFRFHTFYQGLSDVSLLIVSFWPAPIPSLAHRRADECTTQGNPPSSTIRRYAGTTFQPVPPNHLSIRFADCLTVPPVALWRRVERCAHLRWTDFSNMTRRFRHVYFNYPQ